MAAPGIYRYLLLALDTAALWRARSRQRRQFLDLVENGDPHLLADIGLSRDAALAEARLPFWRPWPMSRHRKTDAAPAGSRLRTSGNVEGVTPRARSEGRPSPERA